jgi:hypothetical protein
MAQSQGGKAVNHIGDSNKMVSDTPISDSTPHNVGDLGMLCRRLERELDESNAINWRQQLLDEENLRLQDRIKRLEEALSEIELAMKQPASNHRLMQIAGPARQVINIIKKAKEAKL